MVSRAKVRPPRIEVNPIEERLRLLSLAERLREARQAKEWSYHDLAASSGLTAEGIRQIEAGRSDPSTGTLLRIARALDCCVHWLAFGKRCDN